MASSRFQSKSDRAPLDTIPNPPPPPAPKVEPDTWDPLRAQWVNLLPPLEGRSVLIWGNEDPPTAAFLFARGCRQLTWVGSQIVTGERPEVIHTQSFGDIPHNSVDIAVIRRTDIHPRSRSRRGLWDSLAELTRLLKPDGSLILICPSGIRSMGLRLHLGRALAKNGFAFIKTYLVDSSAYFVTIIPYSENPGWARKYLTTSSFRSGPRAITFLKSAMKTALYRLLGTSNPRYGILVHARTTSSQEQTGSRSLSERVGHVARKEVRQQKDPAVVLWTRPHSDKHHFFAHDPGNSCLLAVGQVSGQVRGLAGMVERSHRNLSLLSRLSGKFAEINVALPRLLDSECFGDSTFYVRSAVGGETLDNVIHDCHRRDDRETLERLMTQALDLQIRIQDLLTEHVAQDAYPIEGHYFENYLGLPPEEDASLSESGSRMVQHGDFAPVNILVNPQRVEWGVIDWEWMGTSFPPLFDLFTFCSRVHYLQRRRKGLTFFQEFLESFVDSYFSPTWFSAFVRSRILRYCEHFQIPNWAVYSFFVRYMRFQCGKYRHAMPGYPDFQHSYEECLKWSIKNKERFICR